MPTVALDGTRFYYEERGSGPPLLLIHGTGGNTAMLAPVAQLLAASHRVITYDRRGFTQTAVHLASKKAYFRTHADDAAALLRELGAPRAAVFGWSMGGVVALGLAVHHPAAVSRLVLYEAPLHTKKHLTLGMARKLGGVVGLAKIGLQRRSATRFYRFAFGYKDGGNAFDELDAPMRDAALANARATLAEAEAGTGEELSRADLARVAVRCPIGLIVGGRSAPFLIDAVKRSAELFPSARVIRIPDGDHVMNIRRPSVLAHAIEDLLSDANARAET